MNDKLKSFEEKADNIITSAAHDVWNKNSFTMKSAEYGLYGADCGKTESRKDGKMKKIFIGLVALAVVLLVITSTLQGISRAVIGVFQEFPSNYKSLQGYEEKLERLNKALSNPKCTFAEVREDLRGRTEDELHYLRLILKTYKELDRKGLLKI